MLKKISTTGMLSEKKRRKKEKLIIDIITMPAVAKITSRYLLKILLALLPFFPPQKSLKLFKFQDEIERSVREVNELLGNEEIKSEQPVCNTETDISSRKEMNTLKIESRHLNPNNEFKRIFGPKVVNTSMEFRYVIFVSIRS